MDYEKLYKKALERASKLRFQNPFDTVSQMMEHVFPELKESEDKRVKKELIELISCMHDADPRKKGWIAWLEKQGETFTKKDVEDAYLQGVCDAKQELEKQGEPFDDNIITRDDEILQAISIGLTDAEKDLGWSDFGGLPIEEIHAWLEKQPIISPEEMLDLLQMEYSKGRYDTITKAIEWLDEHLLEYWGQQNSDPSNFFIDFKKAMEL